MVEWRSRRCLNRRCALLPGRALLTRRSMFNFGRTRHVGRNAVSDGQSSLPISEKYYRLGKYSYARETDRSSSRALPPMNARLGMLEAIIMTVIPKQSQLKMVRFKILTEDHLYE